jgi:hypothetical protein
MTASTLDIEAIFHAARDIPDPDRRRRQALGRGDRPAAGPVRIFFGRTRAPASHCLRERHAGRLPAVPGRRN